MASSTSGELFGPAQDTQDRLFVNERCRIDTREGPRVVSVQGAPWMHYAVGDRAAEAHVMVSLVEQGWARQVEVARSFGCTTRTVRRHQQRFAEGGLAALGRGDGYPKGRPRVPASRALTVDRWKSEGVSNREIARRLAITEKAVRNHLRRLGWRAPHASQMPLPIHEGADPNLSGSEEPCSSSQPHLHDDEGAGAADALAGTADPNLSASKAPEPTAPAQAAETAASQGLETSSESADSNK